MRKFPPANCIHHIAHELQRRGGKQIESQDLIVGASTPNYLIFFVYDVQSSLATNCGIPNGRRRGFHGFLCIFITKCLVFSSLSFARKWKIGSLQCQYSSYILNTAILHFHDYGRKSQDDISYPLSKNWKNHGWLNFLRAYAILCPPMPMIYSSYVAPFFLRKWHDKDPY